MPAAAQPHPAHAAHAAHHAHPPHHPPPEAALPAHEQGRADFHALTGALLQAPPGAGLLAAIAAAPPLPGPGAPALQRAWHGLRSACAGCSAAEAAAAHAALFDAVGQPLVDPYASRYLAGALMDRPLAALRADLRALGLERSRHSSSTEDHLAALCECMRLLITGAPGVPAQPPAVQRRFFDRHIAPWAQRCCDDVARAAVHALGPSPGAALYAAWADFAGAFLATEAAAFALVSAPADHTGPAVLPASTPNPAASAAPQEHAHGTSPSFHPG